MQKLFSYKRHYNFFRKRTVLATLILIFSLRIPVFAAFSPRGIPDSSDIRSNLIETWFEAPLDMVRMNGSEKYTAKNGNVFEVRIEETDDIFAIIVAPQNKIAMRVDGTITNYKESVEIFSADSPGSWILFRDKKTGAPISIRFYFAYDSDVFVNISMRQKDMVEIDFMIYNMYAANAVPVRLPFSRFYDASIFSLFKWTEKTLPWDFADIHTGIYHRVQQMIGMIRANIADLEYKYDAMLDERENQILLSTGAPTEIGEVQDNESLYANRLAAFAKKLLIQLDEDAEGADEATDDEEDKEIIELSSGGFAKWICDGLVMPIAGGGLFRSPLIVPTVTNRTTSYQGVLSQEYNLHFALDWTRNLASAVRAVESGRELRYPDSGVDVSIEPFKAEQTSQGISRISGYTKNVGYAVSQLRAMLFVLAVTDPGKWYLGALRETDKNVSPEIHAFNECIAFFPYFDDNGRFNCVVFANCEELDLKRFVEHFQNEFIHLTRLNASDYFFPTRILPYESLDN